MPGLAAAIRHHVPGVTDLVVEPRPSAEEIAAVREAVRGHDVVIAGTFAASLQVEQGALVRAVMDTGIPTVTVALRTPYDLATYPASTTHLCSYGILAPTMDAVAAALFGRIPTVGRLPAAIPVSIRAVTASRDSGRP